MRPKLENGDVEFIDYADLRTHGFMHENLGPFRAAIKQDSEYRYWSRHMDSLADSFQHAFGMLVLEEALKYMVGGQDDPLEMNAEAAANDSEGTLRRCIGWPGYHGNRGPLYRIGNVSWGHRLIRQGFLM